VSGLVSCAVSCGHSPVLVEAIERCVHRGDAVKALPFVCTRVSPASIASSERRAKQQLLRPSFFDSFGHTQGTLCECGDVVEVAEAPDIF